ncbi:hypothetical protein [Methanoculleus bourgensis]|uniref:Uncharacterized protein n=1 Tax=Methanoculleus bourgensis TaxID=83986 RepID=A0A0X3BLK9_9EURY|nr:hypothetical protein [Methanoculleus bourgensis]CVK32883.1 exported protein of unknown function [Methanoculleus bourgensis]
MPGKRRSAGGNTRLLLVAASVIVAFAANAAGLFFGVTSVLPHLFYLPIVLVAYWFPRRGTASSLALSLGYLAMTLPSPGETQGWPSQRLRGPWSSLPSAL